MDESVLEKQFDFYLRNQDHLVARYNGRVLVIHDEKVVGDFDDKVDAYRFGKSHFALGKFLLIKCAPCEDEYTIDYRTVHRYARLATI